MLELAGISAGYGEAAVVDAVDLKVPAGSTVALLGPNGAGKSTLLKVASGMLRPYAGKVLLDERDVTSSQPHQRAAQGICAVPEGKAVYPNLTVQDNLAMFAREDVDDALERAVAAFPKLGQRMRQTAGTMSGGEQQMVALARAYIQRPRFVLLDEVSMGLAPSVVDEVFAFLDVLRSSGASLLLVEQYVGKALTLADYVVLLVRGRLAFAGEPSELDEEQIFRAYAGLDARQ